MKAGVNLVRLFAPEHGINTSKAEGAVIDNLTDAETGLEVISLYGENLAPLPHQLADLDAVIFDLADVGVRFYTYIWTLSYVLEVCGEYDVPVYVLDRPNPLGGDLTQCEGPMLDEAECFSFVGRWSMPIRYGLSIGELASFWVSTRSLPTDLTVIDMPSWDRAPILTDVAWIPPSPNIPSAHTAALYPGTCFAEGLNLAEGRGSPYPFRTIAAPWIGAKKLSSEFNALQLPGILSTPHEFVPAVRTHQGEQCYGVYLTVTDPLGLQPVLTGFSLFTLIAQLWPAELKLRTIPLMPGESETATSLDKLVGRRHSFEKLLDGTLPNTIQEGVNIWTEQVIDFLAYR